ncbi:MAG: hypothetical protein HY867_00030 [Chloroflexi bacterium]|nr:hypothetical protein [Chloroflexota bacterium]
MNKKNLISKAHFQATVIAIVSALLSVTVALAAAGVLDPTFDGDGKVVTNLGGTDSVEALVIQPDGKILVAGYTNKLGGYDFSLARYNSNGTLDTSFDGDGIVITDILSKNNKGRAIALQPDDKIVVGGEICYSDTDCDFALARYNSNGSLDASFDGDGIVVTDFDGWSDEIKAVAIQSDNKIVAAGFLGDSCCYSAYALARYNSNGSLDTSFDGDGKVEIGIGWLDFPQAMVIQPDHKIIVMGTSDTEPMFGEDYISLARFNSNGSLDTSFDSDGRVVVVDLPPHSYGRAIALQTNGKIIVAGSTGYPRNFALVRLNTDGSPDIIFDGDGIVTTDFGGSDIGRAVAIQWDGKIVIAGSSDRSGTNDLALARYHRDGSLDTSFSGDGKALTSIQTEDAANAIALQSNGNIVVAGASDENFALARYDEGGLAYLSSEVRDGWILESTETSNTGGVMNNTAVTFQLGDGPGDAQYRSILAFTTSLPPNAVITKVTLKIKVSGALVGNNNPFSWGNGLKVDVCTGYFGNPSLQLTDFNFNNATNCKLGAGTFGSTPTSGWYSANLISAAWSKIARDGSTQFRLRFAKDDNDDSAADYWRFFSGDYTTTSLRPTLIIEYYVP